MIENVQKLLKILYNSQKWWEKSKNKNKKFKKWSNGFKNSQKFQTDENYYVTKNSQKWPKMIYYEKNDGRPKNDQSLKNDKNIKISLLLMPLTSSRYQIPPCVCNKCDFSLKSP